MHAISTLSCPMESVLHGFCPHVFWSVQSVVLRIVYSLVLDRCVLESVFGENVLF